MTQQGDTTSQEPGPGGHGEGGADTPAARPADDAADTPAAETPAADTPAAWAADTPAARPTDTPAAWAADTPAARPTDTPAAWAADTPAADTPAADTPGARPGSPAAPVWPSPYMTDGQPVPQAYPAPARPGQPRYGDAAATVQGARRPGFGQSRFAQSRFGQPGFGQPGPGQTGPGQTGPGRPGRPPAPPRAFGQAGSGSRPLLGSRPLPQRDPVLASAWERLLAMTLDWILIMAASILILHGPMLRLWHQFEAIETSTVNLSQTAAQSAVSNFMQHTSTVDALQNFRLLLFGLALAYFWVLTAAGGATVGKRLLGLRAVTADGRSAVSVRAAGIRAVVFLIGPALFTFAPGIGLVSSDLTATVGGCCGSPTGSS
jgi:uncharacterized RDD family membrane protein YckC